jgi:hypothetical protein
MKVGVNASGIILFSYSKGVIFRYQNFKSKVYIMVVLGNLLYNLNGNHP